MKRFHFTVVLILAIVTSDLCSGYGVGHALTLDQIAEESDVIFKATVLSSSLLKDSWFKKHRGFDSYATRMRVVSTIKGNIGAPKVVFQHYGPAKDPDDRPFSYAPQAYYLTVGKSYIIFAKKTERQGVFRQLWKNHKSKADQGVFLADDREVAKGIPVKEIIWRQLNRHLASSDTQDVIYAIDQLDRMSRMFGWFKLDDFDRQLVMCAVHRFLTSKDEHVAKRAIEAVGARSPYLRGDSGADWLATVGGGQNQGFVKRDKDVKNTSARKYRKQLIAVADADNPPAIRALAIRALGRASEPGLMVHAVRWSKDTNPLVRQAGIVLLADFPGKETLGVLQACSKDGASEARIGVARAIGFGQFKDLLPILAQLLEDKNDRVRTAAALSLVSFSAGDAGEILRANAGHQDFKSVFVNALAETDAKPYLNHLVEIIEKRLKPRHFWGGWTPYARSWDILFAHVKLQDKKTLESTALAPCLNALEDAEVHSSSEPRDLYAFYVKHKMLDRARRFRKKCKATISFDMEYYFGAVDKRYGIGGQ